MSHQFQCGKDCHIAPTARVANSAILGDRVRVGDWTVIGERVHVGAGTFIGPHCTLGEPTRAYYKNPDTYEAEVLEIGANSIIRAYTCIYSGAQIGERFECGTSVCIREKSLIGPRCSIGTHGDVQGYCEIGEGTRIHSSCHVTQYASIGKYVWLFPEVLLLNDPVAPTLSAGYNAPCIGDYSLVLSRALLMPGVKLGIHAVVGANAKVANDVPDWTMVAGDPAKKVCDARKFFVIKDGKIHRPYPWMLRMREGYPWEKEIPPEWTATR